MVTLSRSEKRIVNQYYTEVLKGSITQSRRVLYRITTQLSKKEPWHHGYMTALDGMVTAQETHDTMAYINVRAQSFSLS